MQKEQTRQNKERQAREICVPEKDHTSGKAWNE